MLWGFSLKFWESVVFWALTIAAIFGAVSVIAAFMAGFLGNQVSGRVQKISDGKIAEAKKDAASANGAAAKANERAAELEKEAAQSKERATELEKRVAEANARALEAQLALEKFKAPRVLSAVQQRNLSQQMKQFAGHTFDVAASQEKESLDLVVQIEDALKEAGWTQTDWTTTGSVIKRNGRPVIGIAIESGITIQVDKSREKDLLPIAKALAASLVAENIEAEAVFAWHGATNTIHVVVGAKPR
jgi:F0F1-type ATP synthase membrane subunit b/b'